MCVLTAYSVSNHLMISLLFHKVIGKKFQSPEIKQVVDCRHGHQYIELEMGIGWYIPYHCGYGIGFSLHLQSIPCDLCSSENPFSYLFGQDHPIGLPESMFRVSLQQLQVE